MDLFYTHKSDYPKKYTIQTPGYAISEVTKSCFNII